MKSERDEQIVALIDRLTREIGLARTYSLALTAHMLEMAKLDLLAIIYSISDDELRLFSLAVADIVAREKSNGHLN